MNVIIEGELSPNSAPFIEVTNNVTARNTTSAKVSWSVPNWVAVGDQGPDQTSPNLAPIIQEIVNQPGWNSGTIVLIIRDDPANPSAGVRCAEAGPGDDSALLHIDFE